MQIEIPENLKAVLPSGRPEQDWWRNIAVDGVRLRDMSRIEVRSLAKKLKIKYPPGTPKLDMGPAVAAALMGRA